jgi:hypothetical protein
MGGPSSWGLGVGLTNLHRKNKFLTKIIKDPRTWTDSLIRWAGHVAGMEVRGTRIGYWWESQKETDH